jgi:hypothetical protein
MADSCCVDAVSKLLASDLLEIRFPSHAISPSDLEVLKDQAEAASIYVGKTEYEIIVYTQAIPATLV